MTRRMTAKKAEPRDSPEAIVRPPNYQLVKAPVCSFDEYEEAVKDVMFLSTESTLGMNSSKTHLEMETALKRAQQIDKKMQMILQHLTKDEILRQHLAHARKKKVSMDLRSLAHSMDLKSVDSNKSSSSSVSSNEKICFVPLRDGMVQAIPVDPIPALLPRSTASKLKQFGLVSSYSGARKNDKKRKEARILRNDLSRKEMSSTWRKKIDFSATGMAQQNQWQSPRSALMSIDFSPLTACVAPNLDAVISSSTSCMMPRRGAVASSPVNVPNGMSVLDDNDMDDMETILSITSVVPKPASQPAEAEPTWTEKTFLEIAKLKREVKRLQRKESEAETAAALAAAAVPPPTALTPDSAISPAGTHGAPPIPEQEPFAPETRREILKIKRELREFRRLSAINAGNMKSVLSADESIVYATTTLKTGKKTVRFCDPLVTRIKFRPRTKEADKEKLYFCPAELEEFEWDRETTAADQFECIAQEKSNVAVSHELKRYCEFMNDEVSVSSEDSDSFYSTSTDDASNAVSE
jgi:hypothetical protein